MKIPFSTEEIRSMIVSSHSLIHSKISDCWFFKKNESVSVDTLRILGLPSMKIPFDQEEAILESELARMKAVVEAAEDLLQALGPSDDPASLPEIGKLADALKKAQVVKP